MSQAIPVVPISGVTQILKTASNLVNNVATQHPNIINPEDNNKVQQYIGAAQTLSPEIVSHLENASTLINHIVPKSELNNLVATSLPPSVKNKMSAVKSIFKTATNLATLVQQSNTSN